MILPPRVVAPLALLVAMLTIAAGFFAGLGDAPTAFFGGQGIVIIGPSDGQPPGRGDVIAGLAAALDDREDVRAASAEVFVTTAIGERSIVARGVDFARFAKVDDASLLRGRAPESGGEAALGVDLAEELGVDVGDVVVVPGSTLRGGISARVVGVFTTSGWARDELLLTTEDARFLADVPAGRAHLIRVRTENATGIRALVESVGPTFTLAHVAVSSDSVVLGQSFAVTADVTNWGRIAGTKRLTVRVDDEFAAEEIVEVGPKQTRSIHIPLALPRTGSVNVTLNPTFFVDVRDPTLVLAGLPDAIEEQTLFEVRATDLRGAPASGIEVRAGAANGTTDADGRATLRASGPGALDVHLVRDGRVEASARTYVVPHALVGIAAPEVLRIVPPDHVVGERDGIAVNVIARNAGGAPGRLVLVLAADGTEAVRREVTIPPGGTRSEVFELPPMPAGRHEVTIQGTTASALVVVYPGDDPRIEAYLTARVAGSPAPALAEDPRAYVDAIVGDIRLAVTALSIAAAALALLGACAVLARHLNERGYVLGVLKAMGATDAEVATMAMREAVRYGALASAIGLAAGIGVAVIIDHTSLVRAFGHRVHPAFGWRALTILSVGSTSGLALVTRGLVRRLLRRPADRLIRGDTSRATPVQPPEISAVLGGAP